jgi:Cytochrome P460
MIRATFVTTLAAVAVAGAWTIAHVRALDDKTPLSAGRVSFPENDAEGVIYMTKDRPVNPKSPRTGLENVAQSREHYVTPATLDALRKGEPIPSGSVITMVQYRAQLDANGNPLKDDNGRFVKGKLLGFAVMEKRSGWGVDYPPEMRNGDWKFQVFTPDREPNSSTKLVACFQCHQSQARNDYVFSLDKIKALAR